MNQKCSEKSRKTRLFYIAMNCTAPVLTTIFLAGTVCWASEFQYGEAVVYNKDPETVMAFSGKGLPDATVDFTSQTMSVSEIIPAAEVNSGAELVEACGIYIDDEFIGAVVNKESIETELEDILKEYREEEGIIEADYAVEPDLKQGVYRSEALVDEADMKKFLGSEKEIISEYTMENEMSVEKLAEDFDMSVDEVKELNPEIESISDGEPVKIKEKVSVLPVKYVKEEQEEEIIELDAFEYGEDYSLDFSGVKGKKLRTYEVTYIDGTEISRKLTDSKLFEFPDETEETYEAVYSESIPEAEEIFSGCFVWPVNGGYISDTFGSDRNHKGLDIAAPQGTEIMASDSGVVLEAGWNDGGYGNYVLVDHENGYVTMYAHASEVYVSAGDRVESGQIIAGVGTTGDSTGNHLHFEIRYDGGFLNPENFLY